MNEPGPVFQGFEIIWVGSAGLVVNILGMIMLGGHGHSHAGGGHSHAHAHGDGGGCDHEGGEGESHHEEEREHGDLNMHAAWLHALGDMLGSVVVVAVGLIIEFAEGDWKYYADPFLTAVILCIITYAAVPLVRSCSKILVQGTPQGVDAKVISAEITASNDDIVDVHDFHLWELEPGNSVGSLHVVFGKSFDRDTFQAVALKIKRVFHRHGVHSVAIQPEFSSHECCRDGHGDAPPEFCEDEVTCMLACEPGCEQPSVCCSDRGFTRQHLHRRRRGRSSPSRTNRAVPPERSLLVAAGAGGYSSHTEL